MVCVLVVEDENSIREVLVEFISDAGYQILEAPSADIALGLVIDPAVRLLITDINLPGRNDGIDLARAARSAHPGIPVVFISGRASKLAEAGALADPVAFLQKPFSVAELVRTVDRMAVPA